jgi:natural product biosynthesis luciferase-like monooxygenase protein
MTLPARKNGHRRMQFGLFFFSSSEAAAEGDRYRLLFESAKFADEHGFSSVWIPERHFTKEGGLYPNPSLLQAALARETRRIHLRAGSVVLPLHHPVRAAEEWAVVDNLSGGRVGVSFASGWHPHDFVFAPEKYAARHEEMYRSIETVRRLWKGETVRVAGVGGAEVEVKIYPAPLQKEIPIWITAAGSPQTCASAGHLGANLLTHLFNQSHEELAEKIKVYREALASAGRDPRDYRVTVAVPAFVWGEDAALRGEVLRAFNGYVKSASYLLKAFAQNRGVQLDVDKLPPQELDDYAQWICDRLVDQKRVLFGTAEECLAGVAELSAVGVDEIICQLDFGVETGLVLGSLPGLHRLTELCTPEALLRHKAAAEAGPVVARDEAHGRAASLSSMTPVDETFDDAGAVDDPAGIRVRCAEELGGPELYARLAGHGAQVDEENRCIEQLWRRDGEALALVRLPAALEWEAEAYQVHPVLLDACLQVLCGALPGGVTENGAELPCVPAGLRRLKVHGATPKQVWSHALWRASADGEAAGDVRVLGERGELLIEALGLRLRPAGTFELTRPEAHTADASETAAGVGPGASAEANSSPTRDTLLSAGPEERRLLLEAYLCEQVARVLEMPASKVDVHQPINSIGLDSLMAIQLKNRVEGELRASVPVGTFLRGACVAELAGQLLPQLLAEAPAPAAAGPRDGVTVHPLSKGQHALWFMEHLSSGDASYNTVEIALAVRGPLDAAALRRSLQILIDRHASLRTVYPLQDERPVQRVLPRQEVDFEEIDAAGWAEGELSRRMAEQARRPFDLGRGPVLRASLFRRSAAEHVLLLAAHHIAVDFLSLEIILNELQAVYFAEREGRLAALPALTSDYADYVRWQAEMLEGPEGERLWDYWQRQLAGEPPALDLPTDRPRPAVPSVRGATHVFEVDAALTSRLRALAKAEGVTLYTVLLSSLAVLLNRCTGREDILVNSPTANRGRSEFEGLVGYFANPVIMRANLSGDPTFGALLGRVHATVVGALDHQHYPFPLLVEQLRPTRDPGRVPFSEVVFNLDRLLKGGVIGAAPAGEPAPGELAMWPLAIEQQVSRYDLVLVMFEGEEFISSILQYKTDLFDAPTMARMAGRLLALLESATARPDARISSLGAPAESARAAKGQANGGPRLRGARRRAVNLSEMSLVKPSYLRPGGTFPLVLTPGVEHLDLAEWGRGNREYVESELRKHGAILFRGFGEGSIEEFERFALSLCDELFGEYGDLPREEVAGKIYGSTPYPPDQAILMHNESSQMHCWPLKIWFYCLTPAAEGGETPVVDCREVYRLLDPTLRARFAEQGLVYVRNFTDGLDVSWQSFFRTTERAEVERLCRLMGMEFEWKADHGLRTRKRSPAVARHPKTGETVFFNQLQAHHDSCLEPDLRRSLLALFGREGLPRNVYYGDGSPIEDAVVEEIREVYARAAVSFPWRRGDILMLDNMLSAHGRNSFRGARKIMVTMGEMFPAESLQPVGEAVLV